MNFKYPRKLLEAVWSYFWGCWTFLYPSSSKSSTVEYFIYSFKAKIYSYLIQIEEKHITCSWHQKNETIDSSIHQITNSKCCKMSLKAFKLKKWCLKCFLIMIITLWKRGFKRLVLNSTWKSWIGAFMVSFFWSNQQVILL